MTLHSRTPPVGGGSKQIDGAQLLYRARRALRQGNGQEAGSLYQSVIDLSGKNPQDSFIHGFAKQAEETLQALDGRGPLGPRIELWSGSFLRELTNPWTLLGFGAGATAYRLVRLGALGPLMKSPVAALAGSPLGPGPLAALMGLGAESVAFVGTQRFGSHWIGGKPGDPLAGFGQEVLHMGLTLGMLRVTGFLTKGFSPQLGMFGGIALSDLASQKLGWTPPKTADSLLFHSLTTLLHFNAAGTLANHLLGPRFHQLQKVLEYRAAELAARPSHPAPTIPDGRNLAVLGLATLSGGGSREVLPRTWMAMASSKDDSGSKNGKVINFPSSRPATPSEPSSSKPPPRDWVLGRTSTYTQEGRKNLDEIYFGLGRVLDFSQIYLRHLQLKRLPQFAAKSLTRKMQQAAQDYERHLKEGKTIFNHLGELAVMARQLGRVETQEYEQVFGEYRALLRIRGEIESRTQGLLEVLGHHRAWEIQQKRDLLQNSVERGFTKGHGLIDTLIPRETSPLPVYKGVEGMLFGIGAKEAFRPPVHSQSLLDPGSIRRNDWSQLENLLRELVDRGRVAQGLERIFFVPFHIRGKSQDVLTFYTKPEKPLEGWFGLALPALVTRFGPSYDHVRAQSLQLEPQLPLAYRPWSAATLWALTQAIKGSGTPAEWMPHLPRALRELPDVREIMIQVLKFSGVEEPSPSQLTQAFRSLGEAAVVPYSLVALFRHAQNPAAALRFALQAPPMWREEILTLTGALVGAYHGTEFFNRNLLEDLSGNWDRPQKRVLEEPAERIGERMPDFARLWTEESPASNLRVLDRPGRVVRPSPPQISLALKLEQINNQLYFQYSSLLDSLARMVRRAQATGISKMAWQDGALMLMRAQAHLAQYRRELKSSINADSDIIAIKRDVVPNVPKESGRKLYLRLEETEGHLQELKSLWGSVSNHLGEVYLTPKDVGYFNRGLSEFRGLHQLHEVELGIQPFQRREYDGTDVQKIHEAALKMGALSSPEPSKAEHWYQRSPWGQVMALVKTFSDRPLRTVSWEEILATYYRQIGWEVSRTPRFQGAEKNIPLGTMLGVLTPAFLEIYRRDPRRAYRELEQINTTTDVQRLEAWRGVTYLSLRLLEGAKPDLFLAQDVQEALRKQEGSERWSSSPLGRRMEELVEKWNAGESQVDELSNRWMSTKLPTDMVGVAYLALMRNPNSPNSALLETPKPHPIYRLPQGINLLRITAMLGQAAKVRR